MHLDRTLIIAPHPDDDVIAAGGLIQRVIATGGELRIVFVTDGENNPWPQRWIEKKWSVTDADRGAWGAMRRIEGLSSLTRLCVSIDAATFFALPDQGLASMVRRGDTRLLLSLRRTIAEFRPTLIVAPSSVDLHSDHRTVACATHLAAGETPIQTYVIHGRGPSHRLAEKLDLTDCEQTRKRAAIECHRSQLLLSRNRFLSCVKPTESFYCSEFDLIGVESKASERVAMWRHTLRVVLKPYPRVDTVVPPAIDDVPEAPAARDEGAA